MTSRYPSYRNVDYEWLESVPFHWGTGRLRWLATRFSGGTPDRQNPDFWTDGTVPWLNSGAVNQSTVTEPSAFITEEGFARSSAKWIPKGALVMALAGQGKTKGMVAQLAIPSTCNQSMAAIIPRSDLDNRFLFWWLSSNYQNIRNMAGGDDRDGLNLELLGNIACPLPPLAEQTAIAAFLDRETGKIDALVEEQRRLIDLLREKRQAVISHAVTHGLAQSVRMTPSGIDWLGDVPEHWSITTVGRVCSYLSYGFTNPMPTAADGPYMLTANDIADGYVDFECARRTTPEAFNELTRKSRPDTGDVLVTKDGTLGRVAVHDGTPACINQSVALLRPDTSIVRSSYLSFCLRGSVYQDRMIYDAGGTTIKHIYISRLAKMPFALPPLSEQDGLLQYMTVEALKFDRLATEAGCAIDLLQERRAALIAGAVTGKIDVRTVGRVETVAA
jgi:type I restriction enzyme, S subunit